MPALTVRAAEPSDAAVIVRYIRALADYEHAPADVVRVTEGDVLRDGFGESRYFEVMIAELDRDPVGFALFFHTYSTWEGHAGIHIEDLFVEERARRLGAGRALVAAVARIAEERGCPRLELSVLDWNPAREFYHRLGMTHMSEWLPYRMDPDALAALAASG